MSRFVRRARWVFRMAWRENRRHRRKLLLFISSIAVGIAAIVAINGFRINLDASVNEKAKSLLGADLLLTSDRPFAPEVQAFVDSLDGRLSREVAFSSMVLFPSGGNPRLARIRALEGDYPYYGTVLTAPADAFKRREEFSGALVDNAMLIQFGAGQGDSVRIGLRSFGITGALLKFPGEVSAGATVAPAVFIPLRMLEETGLVRFGSLVSYRFYLKLSSDRDVPSLVRERSDFFARHGVRAETVEQRKRQINRVTENLTAFLNLVGLASLLLGGIGVASSIAVYLRQKMGSVAVLRCLGCTSRQVFAIYLVQTMFFGLLGTILGVGLGILIQYGTPALVGRILPVDVDVYPAPEAIIQGLAGGFVVAALFTLLPLVSIRHVSPLLTLRTSFEGTRYSKADAMTLTVMAALAMATIAFVTLQLDNLTHALIFVAGLGAAIGVFALVARALMWLLRRSLPGWMGYSLRQGLANLHRPNNQTTTLLLALGMGTFVISTLYFVQSALLSQAAFSGKGDRANMVLFDVQPDQKAGVISTMEGLGLPVLGDVSVVTMRLQSINGRSVVELMADSARGREDWALRAELRSTYRSRPSASEVIVQGAFRGEVRDTVYVSVADRYADALGLSLGDRMEFDVQGAPLAAYVGSIRQIRWQSFEPNFLTVFPAGVLEGAPQFSVLLTRTRTADESARFQRAVVAAYPGVSIVDLALVIETVGSVLDEITLVIRFMALFTIVTGLVIMVSSLTASRSQRMREAVLLRTIGARRRTVRAIMVVEYLTLGLLAALLGIGLAWLAAWILSASVFDVPFPRPPAEVLLALAIIPALTVAIGAIGSRRLFEQPPLEALRADG